ncbi:MAG TPA: Uma2 family endonuclease, partial [Gemmataceae bacterium]|nr:Uma2 family endonuclease [Gemmataceae bacterium]
MSPTLQMPPTPPLANGDQLSRDEFERRYETMPNVRAELIEGVVYMSSPVSNEFHGEPHGYLMTWVGVYLAATRGLRLGDNATAKLDWTNEPHPDVLLMVRPEFGG